MFVVVLFLLLSLDFVASYHVVAWLGCAFTLTQCLLMPSHVLVICFSCFLIVIIFVFLLLLLLLLLSWSSLVVSWSYVHITSTYHNVLSYLRDILGTCFTCFTCFIIVIIMNSCHLCLAVLLLYHGGTWSRHDLTLCSHHFNILSDLHDILGTHFSYYCLIIIIIIISPTISSLSFILFLLLLLYPTLIVGDAS